MYGDSTGSSQERMISATDGGPVHGLSGMFSGLMTTTSEDNRINYTGATIGSQFNQMDRAKPPAVSSEDRSEMDGTMGRRDTRRGGRSTRGKQCINLFHKHPFIYTP